MLNFFFTRHDLPEIQTIEATPFEIQSSAEYTDKVIPFSHIYVTSESYLKLIHDSLDSESQSQLITVSERQSGVIKKQQNFPLRITDYQIDTLQELLDVLSDSENINIIVINGIGLGYGDNYIGLGIMQRIAKLLAPRNIHFHLMQTMNKRIAPIYSENIDIKNMKVTVQNNCTSVENFMKMNAYIDLTGILNYKEFGEMSLSRFYSTAFSVENLVPETDIQPKLHISSHKVKKIKIHLNQFFSKSKPLVLIHPEASSPLRSCPVEKSQELVSALIQEGYNVISTRPFKFEHPNFKDCSELSNSTSDLKYIIAACDAVISVGTVTYHLASALGKPTLLLPIVKTDIRTAAKLSNVLVWLPKDSKNHYLNKFKSRDEDDLYIAKKIWNNVGAQHVAQALTSHCESFITHKNHTKCITSNPKVAVIISDFGNQTDLTTCIQSLTKIHGFDPLWMQVIDCKEDKSPNSIALNNEIEQAIQNNCDFVWIISSNMQAQKNYLKVVLERFKQEPKTAMIAGKQVDTLQPNKILWAGSISAFPVTKVNQGYLEENKFTRASNEDWVPFDSVIIRADTLKSVGFLDESMQTQFCDIDYCFTVKLNKWHIRYEPNALALKNTFKIESTSKIESDAKQDLMAFHNKWSEITKCQDINQLNKVILKLIDAK